MPPDAVAYPVCAHDHGHGVPPYYASYVALYFVVAGVRGLILHGYGVYVRGVRGVGNLDAFFLGVNPELSEQFGRPFASGILDHVFKRFDPFPVFGFFFRYLRIFFHCPYKTRRSGAAGEFCNMEKPYCPCNLRILASDAQNGGLGPGSGSPDSEKHFNRRGKNITTLVKPFGRLFFRDYTGQFR